MGHQVDLVDIKKLHTKYKGKVFRYVLSAMDVFSLTLSLADPNRAKAKFPRGTRADTHLQGTWRFLVLQHDQGKEFAIDGVVSRLCKALDIKLPPSVTKEREKNSQDIKEKPKV